MPRRPSTLFAGFYSLMISFGRPEPQNLPSSPGNLSVPHASHSNLASRMYTSCTENKQIKASKDLVITRSRDASNELPHCHIAILPWSHCSVSGICRSPAPPGFICSFMAFQRAYGPVALAAPVAPEAPNVSRLPAPSPAFGEDRCLKRSSRMLGCFLRGSMMQKNA